MTTPTGHAGSAAQPSPRQPSAAMQHTADAVDRFFAEVFRILDDWQPRLADALRPGTAGSGLSLQDLNAAVRDDALAALDSPRVPIFGAGFIGSPEAFPGPASPLAWWQGPEKSHLTATAEFCDRYFVEFQRLEWYRIPEQTHRSHVTGPYVDYLCSTEVTLTSSVPLILEGRFIGVSCLDVLVEALEDILAPPGMFGAPRLTILNDAARVVVSNNPLHSTGDVITPEPHGPAPLRCRRAPFRILAG